MPLGPSSDPRVSKRVGSKRCDGPNVLVRPGRDLRPGRTPEIHWDRTNSVSPATPGPPLDW